MYSNFVTKTWRSARARVLFVAFMLTALLVGVLNTSPFNPSAQAAGQSQSQAGFYNDLRGSDPTGWTSGQLAQNLADAPQAADPAFVYQTIYSGAQFDSGRDEVVDAAGNAYILARAYDSSNDVMVVKFSPTGSMLFVTYLRGYLNDWGTGLALDGQGGLLVAGWTDSSDFPVVNAAQPVKDSRRSGFLARLSTANGAVVYSSFFGAGSVDEFHDVVVNAAGEIYLVGSTDSTDFPTLNPIQASLNLTSCFCADAFIVRLAPDARTVLYSTYLGGSKADRGDSIGLDAAGNIYVAGSGSNDFPTVNPIQIGGGLWAARISADGTHLDYSTHLGGSNSESISRIAVDAAGYTTLVGTTNSQDFPTTPSAYQPVFGGGLCGTAGFGQRSCYDAFVTRLTPDGSSLVYSTYLGGANEDEGHGVVVDSAGNAYIVGYFTSADVPPSEFDIFVASLDASGSQLRYKVNVWSAVANDGHGIALGPNGDVYFTGAMNAPSDLYAARLSAGGSPLPTATFTPPPPSPTPTSTSVPPTPTNTPPQPTATPTAPPSGGSLHVGDLDGSSVNVSRYWKASVSILVHDAGDNPVANVTVSGKWSNGYSGNAQCVTGSNGVCTLSTGNLRRTVSSVTFTVNNLSKSGFTYNAGANHDPDGDSSGTSIVISRP